MKVLGLLDYWDGFIGKKLNNRIRYVMCVSSYLLHKNEVEELLALNPTFSVH